MINDEKIAEAFNLAVDKIAPYLADTADVVEIVDILVELAGSLGVDVEVSSDD